jgi:hypothetical protein
MINYEIFCSITIHLLLPIERTLTNVPITVKAILVTDEPLLMIVSTEETAIIRNAI